MFIYLKAMNNFNKEDSLLIMNELEELEEDLLAFEMHVKKYKGSFFWNENGNSNQRARQEARSKLNINESYLNLDLDIDLDFSIEMSCKNVYQYKTIKVNDNKLSQSCFKSIRKEIAGARKILRDTNSVSYESIDNFISEILNEDSDNGDQQIREIYIETF